MDGSLSEAGVRLVEASTFLNLTTAGRAVSRRGNPPGCGPGRIVTSNRDHRQGFAGRSRLEIHGALRSKPLLKELLAAQPEISCRDQVEWASRIPMADDITAEADSRRAYRRSAGHRLAADDVDPA